MTDPRRGSIDWIPIADMPDALKDGREVLLWHVNGSADVGTWETGGSGWYIGDAPKVRAEMFSYFAEITPPV